ncbi:MAG: retropepsin-like domain-containing protein [Pirellulaceae bacterium]|nr:retropepsin-like domain-containing protein [Pirellulaceae bacterium]
MRVAERMRAGLWAVALALGMPLAAHAQLPASPQEFLRRQFDLIPVAHDKVWMLAAELRIRALIKAMPDLETRILAGQRVLEERVETNQRLWPAVQSQLAATQRALSGLGSDAPQRLQLEAQFEALRRQAVEPVQLGGVPDVQGRLIQLTNDRNVLAIHWLAVVSGNRSLAGRYRELAADPQVQAALAKLGDEHRLGGEKDYGKLVARYERVVLTDWLPLYWQSERLRFCALANDVTPLTFSWREDGGPTLLTASMVERMALTIPDDAPWVPQQVGTRKLVTRRVVIPRLRLGRHELPDLEAYVLPPEGEDLGGMLGQLACGRLKAHLEPERLRIRWVRAD